VTTDPETFAFLQRAMEWSARSDGAFDMTVGPLLRAWGFFFHSGKIPTEAQLQAVRGQVGWKRVQLDAATRTVRFAGGQAMELDPGSIGKGYAVDKVVALLRAQGVMAAFVDAGGSTLYGLGAPPGEAGWPVQVPDARLAGTTAATLLLKDESLSTGACTQKFFIQNGHRYCHIFDPQTLRPVEGMLQATVIDPSATDSDALSTVAFVLTPEASQRFFASLPQTRVLVFPDAKGEPDCVAIHWQGKVCGDARRLEAQ
jgi:thiamine biosynthesis lipoprotein